MAEQLLDRPSATRAPAEGISVEAAPERRPLVAIVALCAVLLAVWLPHLADPFGPSQEGYNGAVWSMSVESIDDLGWLDSRVGTVHEDRVYGHHPPVLTVVTWLSTSVLGDGTWQMRLPAMLASLVAVALLHRLMRSLGASRSAAALGGLAVVASPMMLAHGTMVDTWILGFPLGVLVLLTLTQRKVTRWRAVAVGLCAFCSWQGAILVGLALPVAARRFGWRSSFVVSGVVGMVAAVAFVRWAGMPQGSLDLGWPLDQEAWHRLTISAGFALAFVPFAALVRDRAMGALLIGAPLLFGILFASHADKHYYWFFWALAPVAVGAAVLVDRLGRPGVVAAAVVILLTPVHLSQTLGVQRSLNGIAPEVASLTAELEGEQTWLPLVQAVDGAHWVPNSVDLPARFVEVDEVPDGWSFLVLTGPPPAGADCTPLGGDVMSFCRFA